MKSRALTARNLCCAILDNHVPQLHSVQTCRSHSAAVLIWLILSLAVFLTTTCTAKQLHQTLYGALPWESDQMLCFGGCVHSQHQMTLCLHCLVCRCLFLAWCLSAVSCNTVCCSLHFCSLSIISQHCRLYVVDESVWDTSVQMSSLRWSLCF